MSLKQRKIGKATRNVFGLMGIVTVVFGILCFCFLHELTKPAVELFGLLYLVFITVCCIVFVMLINTPEGNSENPVELKSDSSSVSQENSLNNLE